MIKIDTGLHYPINLDTVPASWTADYVGAVATAVHSGFACGAHSADTNGVAHLRPMNVSRDGKLDLTEIKYVSSDYNDRRLSCGDVLFNNTNSPELIGKTAFVTENGTGKAFSNHMTRLRFSEAVDPKFAAIQLHYLWMMKYFLHRCVKHVNQASISAGDMARSIPITIPPIKEQRDIVAKIEALFSELDQGIESLKFAREQLKIYRQAVLKQAFEGKLTAQWREENRGKLETPEQIYECVRDERQASYERQVHYWNAAVKTWEASDKKRNTPAKPRQPQKRAAFPESEYDALCELPDGWAWLKVGDLCEVVRGGSPRPAGDKRYYEGDIPFLKVADLTRNPGAHLSTYSYTIKEAGLIKTRYVDPNTLMISNSGATLGVPKICVIGVTFNDGIAAFLGLETSDLLYHYYFWSSKTEVLRGINQGAAQPNLNTDLLRETFIPICSRAEMMVIAMKIERCLSLCDRLGKDIDNGISQSEALRQSILKKAFSGQLVPQDPEDEPASVLLERIRIEKDARSKTNKDSGQHQPRPKRAALT